ncbi:hypothetical protein ACFLZJ_01390 [Nanoarchaeota archaeon]
MTLSKIILFTLGLSLAGGCSAELQKASFEDISRIMLNNKLKKERVYVAPQDTMKYDSTEVAQDSEYKDTLNYINP